MRITAIREATVPLQSDLRNAYISFSEMTTSAVAVISDVVRDGRPVVGYGFNSNGRYAAGGILRERLIPRILRADPAELLDETGANLDPNQVWRVMMTGEKPGGHGDRSVAVGAVDMAIWDLVAKVAGEPLCRLLARRYGGGEAEPRIFVYAAGGYYRPGQGFDGLREEMRRYLDLGYTTVKIKIGGAALAEDLRRIEAVLDVVGEGSRLAVDANGRFDPAAALAYAGALAPYGLRWYEEPGDPLDYDLHAAVARSYSGPLATGENLFALQEVRNMVRYGGLRPDRDILQVDPALAYGLVEYLRVLAMLAESGWGRRSCIPHGGHLLAVHVAAGLGTGGNESYPGVFQPFGGFTDGTRVEAGFVPAPELPGIGFEGKSDLYRVLRPLGE